MIGVHEPADVIPTLISHTVPPEMLAAATEAARHCSVVLQNASFDWDVATAVRCFDCLCADVMPPWTCVLVVSQAPSKKPRATPVSPKPGVSFTGLKHLSLHVRTGELIGVIGVVGRCVVNACTCACV